ncbi:MAG: hypothetical protein AAB875_03605, partial [Patescibacteria group bacterium]
TEKTPGELLDEFSDKILTKTPKEGASVASRLKQIFQRGQEVLVNQYAALDRLQAEVIARGKLELPKVTLAETAEQYAGVAGKQLLDQIKFKEDVLNPIKDVFTEFDQYIALRRTLARIETGKKEAKVAAYTKDQVVLMLQELRNKIGTDAFGRIEKAGNVLQQKATEALNTLIEGEVITKEAAEAIGKSSDFYAPFRVIQSFGEEVDEAVRAGRSLQVSKDDLLKRLKGIKDEDFKIFSPSAIMASNIAKIRAVAEKNKVMQNFTELAKVEGVEDLIRPLKKGEKTPKGKELITIYEKGREMKYVVSSDVARAVKGLNNTQMGTVARTLNYGSKPFKFGALTLNAAFQLGNLLAADIPTNILFNKLYGLKPEQFFQMPFDYIKAFYSSITLTVPKITPNKLAREFLESGAASSTIARVLAPGAFLLEQNRSFFRQVAGAPTKMVAKFGDVFETTSKLAGFQAVKRLVARGEISMAEMVTEVRRYAGSPDFARKGEASQNLNIWFMFFNARTQGIVRDLKRLAPFTKGVGEKWKFNKASAETWVKLSASVGAPTTALMLYNLKPELREHYEKVPQWEKDNYFIIPKSMIYGMDDERSWFVNEDGERILDAWKIQKREAIKIYANIIESAVQFATDRSPDSLGTMFSEFVEGISPIS